MEKTEENIFRETTFLEIKSIQPFKRMNIDHILLALLIFLMVFSQLSQVLLGCYYFGFQ